MHLPPSPQTALHVTHNCYSIFKQLDANRRAVDLFLYYLTQLTTIKKIVVDTKNIFSGFTACSLV